MDNDRTPFTCDLCKKEYENNLPYAMYDEAKAQIIIVCKKCLMHRHAILQDTFSFEKGKAILAYPANMRIEDFEDLKSWLELQIRKIKRHIEENYDRNKH